MSASRGSWWHFSAGEARVHSTLAAVALWTVALVVVSSGTGYRSAFGSLKGTDFIHFYTLGHLTAETAPATQYDAEALYRLQTQLVPESAPERYLTPYPPHAALLFRPFAGLSYGTAALLWAAVLFTGYFSCLWLAWRPFQSVLADRPLVIAAALAFPPFWYLVLHGQPTVVVLVAFCLGWLALDRGRRFWAGAAFGLLALKPQFGLILAPLVLVCREWRILAGAATSISVQVIAIVAALGVSAIVNYLGAIAHYPAVQPLLEPRPAQLHSLYAMTTGLPGWLGIGVWAGLSVLALVITIRVWRSKAPTEVRCATLVLSSVFVNPHVFVYDATVVALPLLWLFASVYGRTDVRPCTRATLAALLYPFFVSFIAPTAAVFPVQASVVFIGGLVAVIGRQYAPMQIGSTSLFRSSLRLAEPARRGGP